MLREEAQSFFMKHFCDSEVIQESTLARTSVVPNLSDIAKNCLIAPVQLEEVRDAIIGMKSFKAPGPDGFQSIFFKQN